MKILAKIALIAVSLLLSAGLGFASDVKAPAKAAGDGVKGDAKASVAGKENAKGKVEDAKATVKAKAKIVDINSATDAELKGVPGIGDAFAAKIIAGRPYANKTQLKSRKIMPSVQYEQVKDQLIARQPQK
jgi:competence protein ComEA